VTVVSTTDGQDLVSTVDYNRLELQVVNVALYLSITSVLLVHSRGPYIPLSVIKSRHEHKFVN